MSEYAEIMEEFEDALAPDIFSDPSNPTEVQAQTEFTPTTDEQFEWAMRKRSRANAEIAALNEHMERELYELRQAFGRRIAKHQRTADFFTGMIERGIEAVEPDAKGKQTVNTVVGTIYVRHSEHFEWPEDSDLIAWAKSNLPDAVKVKESPDKTAIKAHVKATGEVPAGLTITAVTSTVIKEA